MKKIAVFIPYDFWGDSRALRTVSEMQQYGTVDVFHIPKLNQTNASDKTAFHNTKCIALQKPADNLINKILKNSHFTRIFSYVADEIMKHGGYDVLYVHDLESAYVGLQVAQKTNCKLIYDVHDLYIETLNQQFPMREGKNTFSWKHRFMYNLMIFFGNLVEKKIMKKADLVYTVNESCSEYLTDRYPGREVLYFRNFPAYFDMPKANKHISQQIKKSDVSNIIIYIGSFGRGRHLSKIVKSAQYLQENTALVMIGSGNLKRKLINIAKKNQILDQKVFFLDKIPYTQLFESIAEAKLGIMLLDPINKSKEYALANKISEYMGTGIPVLLSDHIEHQKIIRQADFGYITKDYTPKRIAGTINAIVSDPDQLKIKSQAARKAFVEQFNWDIEKSRFITSFEKCLYDSNS